jgi:hypothetical protein
MGHLVKVAPKTGEILKWALVELSLTPNPANPNAYIVRGNKSASAHVKSLFATKHGDHDQSEHGNWASGGGADKGDDKDKTVANAIARRDHNAQEARAEAKQGIDKAYEKSGLSRPGYVSALPEPGMTDKQAFDHGYKEGTAKPTLSYQEDRIRTTGELMQALGLWKAINEQDPLGGAGGDMKGREWLSATAATSAESDRAAADIHEDNNWHNSAAVLRAVAEGKEWLETHDYGKKSLKVKRSVKHGDHDQSEHGNWATGGGGSDKGERGKHDSALTNDQWRAMEAVSVDSANIARHATVLGTFAREMSKDMEGDGNDASRRAWDLAAQYADAVGGGSVNLREYVQDNPHGETAAQIAGSIDQEAQSMEQAQRSMEEFWQTAIAAAGGINTPSEVANSYSNQAASVAAARDNASRLIGAKTFKVKRAVKHGDHDQSEHGNWATGGGSDKEDKGARDTNRVENNRRSSGAWQEKFGKVGEYRATGETIELAKTLVSEASDHRSANERVVAALHMASQWNSKGPVTMPNGQIPLHGRSIEEELAHRAELSPSEADKEFHINLLADLKGETPEQIQSDIDADKFNDWMSGYEVPGMPKTFRAKRT